MPFPDSFSLSLSLSTPSLAVYAPPLCKLPGSVVNSDGFLQLVDGSVYQYGYIKGSDALSN